MHCRLIDCPFFDSGIDACGLVFYQNRSAERLILASLDIGRSLADRQRITFKAQGTCMYPCIRQGDTLRVEPVTAVAANVGAIAVIRRGNTLLAHRIVSKGCDERGAYIVTCPDRSSLGNDGPTHDDGLLGVVVQAERNGTDISLDPVRLGGHEQIKVSLWEWWHWRVKSVVIRNFGVIQRLFPYRFLAAGLLRIRYPSAAFSVRVPLKPLQRTDLSQVFQVSDFDVNAVKQKGYPVAEWVLQLEFRKRVPAAWVRFVRRPDNCPYGGGWYANCSWTRLRYLGAGLEARLVKKGEDILSRDGHFLSYQVHEDEYQVRKSKR